MDFLINPVPWCRHCDWDSKEIYHWARSKGTIDEWVTEPCEPPMPLPQGKPECPPLRTALRCPAGVAF